MCSIPDIGSNGDSEDGVIDPSHKGDIELGGSVVMVGAVVAEGVFGTPHTRDSVPLIFLSLVSHIGFRSGVTWATPVDEPPIVPKED